MESNAKQCRNCGGTEFFSKEVYARGGQGPNLLPVGFWTTASFRIRVCGGCGLVEWFVSPEYLDAVKKKFEREA
jgi:predicted nucleic-acid-binding Zn-ribbon protein